VTVLRLPFALAPVPPKGCTTLPRREARVFTSIWKDEDFIKLPRDAQWLYLFLLSQDDLSYCGVLPLRPGRWVRKAGGLTVAAVRADLAVLAGGERPFVVVDEDTAEVLVRSLIRHDGIWKMPNIMKAAREAAESVESPEIRAVLLAELERIPADGSESKLVREVHAAFVADLRGLSGNPSPNPSRMGNENHAEEPGYPQVGGEVAESRDETTVPASPQARASRNPSRDPSVNPSQGIGGNYPPPLSPSPEPLPPTPRDPARLAALLPATVTDLREGEGDIPDERTPKAVAALIAELLAIRDDWGADGIRRVLEHPNFTRRPWSRGVAALLAVARDPETDGPGRVTADGSWWRAAAPKPARPPWCGKCDETNRMRETDDGLGARHCPECHPAVVRKRTA
jgi:hypothetical protein